MKRAVETAYGCFHLKNGIPDEFYAFTDGEIAAQVERNGGINNLGCLDIFEFEGKLYPDRGQTPIIFRKEGNMCGKRPLYGPAVQFISTNRLSDGRGGRKLFHVPDQITIYPFGFRSESLRFGNRTAYDMAIDGRSVLFSLGNDFPSRDELIICVNKGHIFQGKACTLKNQVVDVVMSPCVDLCGHFSGYSRDVPFKDNREFNQQWDFLGFSEELNGLLMEGVMRFAYGEKKAVVLLTANQQLSFQDTKYRYLFKTPWEKAKEIKACLVVAESKDEARKRSAEIFKNFKRIFTAKIKRAEDHSKQAPQFTSKAFPEVAQVGRTAPSFLRSMIITETEKEACIRAANYHFGFFITWDQIWPAKGFALMGHWDTAKKLLRYNSSLPPQDLLAIVAVQDIITIEDIVAVTGDMEFLKEMYPRLVRFYDTQYARISSEGLLPGWSSGADDPHELEIYGDIWTPDGNGWWYGACRAMENMAILMEDVGMEQKAHEVSQRIERHYLDLFYDPKSGYLYAAVEAGTRKIIPVYMNVTTLGMDYPYMEYLLYPRIREIAEFQAYELYHPAGRSAVAYWDRADEMWHSCIMFQHIAHEMRTARAAGMGDEITRMMKVYLGLFDQFKTARETHNIVGCSGDEGLRSDWQAFGTRALYSGIVEGLIGIQCDLGGFQYVPCDVPSEMDISGFRFRKGKWDIQIKGQGAFVKRFIVDGKTVPGTMKVPAEYIRDAKKHTLIIEKSAVPFKTPVLLSAVGAAVCNVDMSQDLLTFTTDQKAHAKCKVYSPKQPSVVYGDQEVPVQWYADRHVAWFDVILEPDRYISVSG